MEYHYILIEFFISALLVVMFLLMLAEMRFKINVLFKKRTDKKLEKMVEVEYENRYFKINRYKQNMFSYFEMYRLIKSNGLVKGFYLEYSYYDSGYRMSLTQRDFYFIFDNEENMRVVEKDVKAKIKEYEDIEYLKEKKRVEKEFVSI